GGRRAARGLGSPLEGAPRGGGGDGVRLDVVADDLLLDGVRRAAEDPRLRGRPVAVLLGETAIVDAPLAQGAAQRAAVLVGAHDADRGGLAPQGLHVRGCVARPAREVVLTREAEDDDRSLARDTARVPVDEAVEDEVASDDDAAAGKQRHEREESPPGDIERHGCAIIMTSPATIMLDAQVLVLNRVFQA